MNLSVRDYPVDECLGGTHRIHNVVVDSTDEVVVVAADSKEDSIAGFCLLGKAVPPSQAHQRRSLLDTWVWRKDGGVDSPYHRRMVHGDCFGNLDIRGGIVDG